MIILKMKAGFLFFIVKIFQMKRERKLDFIDYFCLIGVFILII